MVMQYLVQRNEEYMKQMVIFTESVEKILDRLEVLEYNIKEMKTSLNHLVPNEAEDERLKEVWYAQRGRK